MLPKAAPVQPPTHTAIQQVLQLLDHLEPRRACHAPRTCGTIGTWPSRPFIHHNNQCDPNQVSHSACSHLPELRRAVVDEIATLASEMEASTRPRCQCLLRPGAQTNCTDPPCCSGSACQDWKNSRRISSGGLMSLGDTRRGRLDAPLRSAVRLPHQHGSVPSSQQGLHHQENPSQQSG